MPCSSSPSGRTGNGMGTQGHGLSLPRMGDASTCAKHWRSQCNKLHVVLRNGIACKYSDLPDLVLPGVCQFPWKELVMEDRLWSIVCDVVPADKAEGRQKYSVREILLVMLWAVL